MTLLGVRLLDESPEVEPSALLAVARELHQHAQKRVAESQISVHVCVHVGQVEARGDADGIEITGGPLADTAGWVLRDASGFALTHEARRTCSVSRLSSTSALRRVTAVLGGQMTPDRWMNRGSRYGRSLSFTSLAAALLGILTGGCGQADGEEADATQEPRSTAAVLRYGFAHRAPDPNEMSSDRVNPAGMATNGMATNGMATNGMATNGMATNGLSVNAMNGNAFIAWFNQDAALANMVMHYVVGCGVSDGSSRAWTNPTTGIQYVWNGASA